MSTDRVFRPRCSKCTHKHPRQMRHPGTTFKCVKCGYEWVVLPKRDKRATVRSVSIVLQGLFSALDAGDEDSATIARKSGIHRNSLYLWRTGKSTPNIVDVECLAEALGLTLSLEPLEEGKHYDT